MKRDVDKVSRYGWKVIDEPGKFMMLDKHDIRVDTSYQREAIKASVTQIASSWSWIACGVIIVAQRGNGYWCIDGDHRLLAARERRDISKVPCLVFKSEGVSVEAQAFVRIQKNRHPLLTFDTFRALVTAGDEAAQWLAGLMDRLGIEPTRSGAARPNQLAALNLVMRMANADRAGCERTLKVASKLCQGVSPIHKTLLEGLWHIERYCGPSAGLSNERLVNRMEKVGVTAMMEKIGKARIYFSRGGGQVCAQAILDAVNRGLSERYVLREVEPFRSPTGGVEA